MTNEEIKKLAELARINISNEDVERYKKDFKGILNYLNLIKNVDIELSEFYETNLTRNIMREDGDAYEAGMFSDELLNEAPNVDGGYIKVKKVL